MSAGPVGARADLHVLDAPSPDYLAYRVGVPLTHAVYRRGVQGGRRARVGVIAAEPGSISAGDGAAVVLADGAPADHGQRLRFRPGLVEHLGEQRGLLCAGHGVLPVEDEERHAGRAECPGQLDVGPDLGVEGVAVQHGRGLAASSPTSTASAAARRGRRSGRPRRSSRASAVRSAHCRSPWSAAKCSSRCARKVLAGCASCSWKSSRRWRRCRRPGRSSARACARARPYFCASICSRLSSEVAGLDGSSWNDR